MDVEDAWREFADDVEDALAFREPSVADAECQPVVRAWHGREQPAESASCGQNVVSRCRAVEVRGDSDPACVGLGQELCVEVDDLVPDCFFVIRIDGSLEAGEDGERVQARGGHRVEAAN